MALSCISIHSPHARGDADFLSGSQHRWTISIHSPHARGDRRQRNANCEYDYFNPLPSCEGRQCRRFAPAARLYFNPLPSCEGRQCRLNDRLRGLAFQSTPLMRGETPGVLLLRRFVEISIHSPHARGDTVAHRADADKAISIHSPHARGDGRGGERRDD